MSLGRTFELPTKATIPAVGFGTFDSKGSEGESYKAVLAALEVGYRHLDCAWYYKNEDEIGDAIQDFLEKNKGTVKREDLFICTKVWNHLHEPEEVEWSLNDSLKKLKLSYVDLFLIHWPVAVENDHYEPKLGSDGKYVLKKELTANPKPTWRAMEKMYDSRKARAIGVSNFTIPGLSQLLGFAKIGPHINQVEIHPFLPNEKLLKFCRDNNILPVAYSPLGSQNQVPVTGERVSENRELIKIAEDSGHTLEQALISWGVKRGYCVLPKSSKRERIESNFQDYEMAEKDYEAINAVAKGRHSRFVNMKDTFGYDVWPECD